MKKLLITTMAAVSLAFCAKAALTTETFETKGDGSSLGEGSLFEKYTDEEDGVEKYRVSDGWYTEKTIENLFTVTNITKYVGAGTYPQNAADRPSKSESDNALAIDTSAPLLRYADSTGDPQSLSDKSIFFDSVVQFTATDVAPSMENNKTDKLAVWLYQSPEDVSGRLFEEESVITELVITAADSSDSTKTKHYRTRTSVDPDSWHRLTIKSFNDEKGDLFFNVWVDTTQVKDGDTVNFKSLIDDTEDLTDGCYKLQGVAFDGKGAVDDIVFTTTAPDFAKEEEPDDPKVFALNLSISADEDAGAMVLTVYADDNEITAEEDGSYKLNVGTKNALAWVLCSKDYKVSNTGATYNEGGYWIVPVDVTGATENGTVNVTITVEKAAGGSAWTDNENFATDLTANVDGLLANVYNKVTGEPTTEQAAYLMTTVGTASGVVTVKVGNETKAATDTFELSVGNNVKIQVPYYEVTEGVVKVATAIIALETVEITVGNESKTIPPAITGELSVTGITSEKNVVGELSNSVAPVKVRDTTDPIKLAFNGVVSTDVFFTKKVYTKADASTTVAYGMTGLDDNAFWFYFQYGQNLDDLRSVWNGGSVNYKIGCYNKGIANVVMNITIDQQFTVKFMNGETVVQSTPVWNGEYVTAPSSNPEAPTGQQFVGWFNGNAEFDATDPVRANVNYTAKFEDTATYPSVGGVTTPEYSVNAKDAIDAAFPNNSYPTGGLTVEVNGEKLTGAKAVEMLNEAVEMFTLAEGANFFDAQGKLDISFKATGANPDAVAYEAEVGGSTATVNAAYEVVPKYIDIATNTELTAKPEGTVTFRLVIQKKK